MKIVGFVMTVIVSLGVLGCPTGTAVNYYSPTIGTLRYVPAGQFQRDTDPSNISVTKPYRMSQHEITRCQFLAIMGTDPSDVQYSTGLDNPVQMVNWYHAIAFCNKLSLLEGLEPVYSVTVEGIEINWTTLRFADIPIVNNDDWNATVATWTNNGYRLPTEMEWMWAAMGDSWDGGLNTTGYMKGYAGSAEGAGQTKLGDYVWYWENCEQTSQAVGTKKANERGLYDMSGNVWEWCWDWYVDDGTWPNYAVTGSVVDYLGSAQGSTRVKRGGSWIADASYFTMVYRSNNNPNGQVITCGFRVVRN